MELFILLGFIIIPFALGYSVLSILWRSTARYMHLFMVIAIAWMLGNGILAACIFVLAWAQQIPLISMGVFYVMLGISVVVFVATLVAQWRMRSFPMLSKWDLLPGILLIVVFVPLAISALNSILIGWDAVSTWFLKAKSIYLSGGLRDNPYFSNAELYPYSHKTYPLGVPLITAVYYQIVGFVDDQLILLWHSLSHLAILFFSYGLVRTLLSKVSQLLTLPLTVAFFITPLFMQYAGNGYVDVALSSVMLATVGGIIFLLNVSTDKNVTLTPQMFLLPFALSLWAAQIKNEGLVFLIGTTLALLTIYVVHRARTVREPALTAIGIGTAVAALLIPIILWRDIIRALELSSYLTTASLSVESLLRIQPIAYHYVNVLLNTSLHSLALIPLVCVLIVQTTMLIMKRSWITLIPLALCLFQLTAYTYVYLVTTVPLMSQLTASFDRLLLHLLPSFFAVGVWQMSQLIESQNSKMQSS